MYRALRAPNGGGLSTIPKLSVTVRDDAARLMLRRAERQVPFAMMLGVNRTADEFVTAQREEMRESFTVRRPWVLNQVRQVQRATKANPEAVVILTPQGGQFLRKFEEGGQKVAGRNPVIVPTKELRPTKAASIPKAMFPKHLRLDERRDAVVKTSARGIVQWFGARRTFILDAARHAGVKVSGVYQRTGPDSIRLLWVFKRSVKIPPLLRFYETGRKMLERLPANVRGFLESVVRGD